MSHSLTAPRRHRSLAVLAASAMVIAGGALVASPAQAANLVVTPGQLDTSETRATGHNVFVPDGVRVYTESNTSTDKATGYFAVSQDLVDVGEPSMDSVRNDVTTTLLPGKQLVTDFDGNGTPDGILVGEPTYADGSPLYSNDWWVSNGAKQFVKDGAPSHVGGSGSPNHGTLDGWRTNFPDAKVLAFGWSVGSGVKSDVTIHSMTLGADTYTFVGTGAPIANPVSASGPLNKPVTVVLDGIDPDGGAVTYTAGRTSDGSVRLQRGSDTVTFRPRYGFAGTTQFTYTVTDTEGLSDTGIVSITIDKAPSTLTLSGRNTYAKNTAYIGGRVNSVGRARGGTVTVKEGAVTVATAQANGQSFRILLGHNITTGQHTYDVTFEGSAQALPSSASVTLTVR